MKRPVIALIVAAVLIVAVVFLWGPQAPRSIDGHATDRPGRPEPSTLEVSARPADQQPRAPATVPSSAPAAVDASVTAPDHTVSDRALRDEIRRRIFLAWSTEAPDAGAALDPLYAPMPERDGGQVDPAYLRDRIREDFLPMATACYEQYLSRAPGSRGGVTMAFTIVGDEHVGGVVDEAHLVGGDGGVSDGGMGDTEFETCMRESMMAMAFRPPRGGGSIDVRYPFTFRPGDAGP